MSDYRIHTYTAAEAGLLVNSYLIESADGGCAHRRKSVALRFDSLESALDGVRLYPGHGASGDVRMLADQRRYLLMYREVVGRLACGAPALTGAQREELTEVMTRFLPGAPLSWMIGLGADAAAAELSS